MLPLTASAHTEVLAERSNAQGRGLADAHHLGFHEGMLLTTHLQVAYIARHGVRYKYHYIFYAREGLALGSVTRNLYVSQQWQRLLFSCHGAKIQNSF